MSHEYSNGVFSGHGGQWPLTYFMPLVSFYALWKYKKFWFSCFQGVWKQTSGIKWVNNRFYLVLKMKYLLTIYPTNIYLFKVNNRNTRKGCKKGQWRRAGVFIVNFKHSSDLFLLYWFWTSSWEDVLKNNFHGISGNLQYHFCEEDFHK